LVIFHLCYIVIFANSHHFPPLYLLDASECDFYCIILNLAVIVIADCMTTIEDNLKTGAQMFEEKYGANAKVAIKIWILLPSWWS
ncbi:MAG: hypothetical protein K0R92_2625, partial [Lachnospiraceae bacterium]|nr:hypothetical protein [Lachnospiraceae bacterium]